MRKLAKGEISRKETDWEEFSEVLQAGLQMETTFIILFLKNVCYRKCHASTISKKKGIKYHAEKIAMTY